MSQGRLATIKWCVVKHGDTAVELNFKAKVTLVKVLSLKAE